MLKNIIILLFISSLAFIACDKDEEREELRQALIESRYVRTSGVVINYDGNHLPCKILEDDTFECALKLPETV